MCDWDEKEYAEYLLWVEAASPKTRVRARPSAKIAKIGELGLTTASASVAVET